MVLHVVSSWQYNPLLRGRYYLTASQVFQTSESESESESLIRIILYVQSRKKEDIAIICPSISCTDLVYYISLQMDHADVCKYCMEW